MFEAILIAVVAIVLGAIGLVIYVIPTIVAFKRRARNRVLILLLNILGGWFYGIAWVAALLWAFLDDVE
jgi:ABC-type Fe3+-siderophore transport system permease subunit